mmetsp:Transcript_6570/g.12798  ORF Transcript_6570/g.12798 Transcript_6570/m.12798 type:complete len:384 (-) Transcript_6570:2110-3261(-)
MAYHQPPLATAVPILPPNAPHGGEYSLRSGIRTSVDEDQIKSLVSQGYTRGLAKALSANNEAFPLRIWVVDNSGSMQKCDGHRIVSTSKKDNVKIVECTRWDEIKECVNYHIQMSALLEAPTTFRMLNHPGAAVGNQMFSVAETDVQRIPAEVEQAMSTMNKARPGGVTPLNGHIRSIHEAVAAMAPQLQAEGKKVAIILATDGLPTDDQGICNDYTKQQFMSSLRLLEGLPVWVVIRLCTDEEDVVEFYNDLDEQLELSLEVLDDFCGEAEEVHEMNPWLNYCLPLHRLREMGFHDRLFDMLDERPLTKSEVREFCSLLFGVDKMDSVPDPDGDWAGFIAEIDRLVKSESEQWNPLKKKVRPLLDVKTLNKHYGDGSACTIM